MKIKARQTKYNGILFRSRLEATWAVFFDLCGWSWTYEPMDLEGWVPDFEITTRKGFRRMLVEVKPFNFEGATEDEIFSSSYKKAINHADDFDILLLGIGPYKRYHSWHDGTSCLGYWLNNALDIPDINLEIYMNYTPGDFAVFKTHRGISHEDLAWDCPFFDSSRENFDLEGFAMELWKKASNKTRKTYR